VKKASRAVAANVILEYRIKQKLAKILDQEIKIKAS